MAPVVQSVADSIAMIDGLILSDSQTLPRNNRRDSVAVQLLMRPPVSVIFYFLYSDHRFHLGGARPLDLFSLPLIVVLFLKNNRFAPLVTISKRQLDSLLICTLAVTS